MDFFFANFKYEDAKGCGDLFYAGPCVRGDDEKFCVAQSADWRQFGRFAEEIADADISKPIPSQDFYFRADYTAKSHTLLMQTDLVGYEDCYCYHKDGTFACSDDLLYLAQALLAHGTPISFHLDHVREFLLFSVPLFGHTIFCDIEKLPPASMLSMDIHSLRVQSDSYDHFRMTGTMQTVQDCAQACYEAVDSYFSNHAADDVCFGIGVSGGLDSRVGAYFAQKYHFNIYPFFVGQKTGPLGLLTFDCKRGEEVAQSLGLGQMDYIDPRKTPIEDRIAFSALHTPQGGGDCPHSIPAIPNVDVLINGIAGGEAYGALLNTDLTDASTDVLINSLMNSLTARPRVRTRYKTLRRIARFLPALQQKISFSMEDPSVLAEIMPSETFAAIQRSIADWVEHERGLGLDGINIIQKFFYYHYAAGGKHWSYASFGNTVPSLNVYMNPVFIRQMLQWKSGFLLGKPVQKAFIPMLGKLGEIRSQTIESSVVSRRKNPFKTAVYAAERVLRGGAIVYSDWFTVEELKALQQQIADPTEIGKTIHLTQDRWFYHDHTVFFSVLKLAYIESFLHL